MKNSLKDQIKGCLTVVITLSVFLIVVSNSIGWNITTLILFWFALVPILSVYLPMKISNNKNHLPESLTGLILFYSIPIIMLYEQYQTDFFKIMIASCIINVGLVTLISLTTRPQTPILRNHSNIQDH